MNRDEAREAAEVMLHYANGGEVEARGRFDPWGWVSPDDNPSFNWGLEEFLKKPPKPMKKYVGLYLEDGEYLCTPAFDYPPSEFTKGDLIRIVEVDEIPNDHRPDPGEE
jgi:hypothetical protein